MSVDRKKANRLLTVVIAVLSVLGIISVWFWHADGVSDYVILLLAASLVLLVRIGATKYDLFELVSKGYLRPSSNRVTLWGLGGGVVCFLLALVWVACVGFAVKRQLISNSVGTIGVFLLPFPVLLCCGIFLIGRAIYGGRR